DAAGAAAGVVVGQQREGADLARPVALLAPPPDDRGDVLRVGHLAGGAGAGGAVDDAAGDLGAGRAHGLAGEQLVERLPQVAAGRRLAAEADAVLVVDPAVVADRPAGVEEEDLGGPLRPERGGG